MAKRQEDWLFLLDLLPNSVSPCQSKAGQDSLTFWQTWLSNTFTDSHSHIHIHRNNTYKWHVKKAYAFSGLYPVFSGVLHYYGYTFQTEWRSLQRFPSDIGNPFGMLFYFQHLTWKKKKHFDMRKKEQKWLFPNGRLWRAIAVNISNLNALHKWAGSGLPSFPGDLSIHTISIEKKWIGDELKQLHIFPFIFSTTYLIQGLREHGMYIRGLRAGSRGEGHLGLLQRHEL